jgi:hypothetical protein
MTQAEFAARLVLLEVYRDEVVKPRIVDHAMRIRAIELAHQKLFAVALAGSMVGGAAVEIFSKLGGNL